MVSHRHDDSVDPETSFDETIGPVVRTGPNNLMVNDPDVIRRVTDIRTGYRRSAWFDSIRFHPETTNLAAERDVKKHAKLRSQIAPSV